MSVLIHIVVLKMNLVATLYDTLLPLNDQCLQERLERQRQDAAAAEVAECTFHPAIDPRSKALASPQAIFFLFMRCSAIEGKCIRPSTSYLESLALKERGIPEIRQRPGYLQQSCSYALAVAADEMHLRQG